MAPQGGGVSSPPGLTTDLFTFVVTRGPVEVVELQGKGCGLVATEDIEAGKLVLEERAMCTWVEGAFNPLSYVPTLLRSPELHHLTSLMSPYEAEEEKAKLDPRVSELRGQIPDAPAAELHRLILVLETNAFPSGLFCASAKINHACRPNCRAFQDGDRLVLETVEPVAKGSELLINYLDQPVLPTLRRRLRTLESTYLFACQCGLCLCSSDSSLEALRCPSCSGETSEVGALTAEGSCKQCGTAASEAYRWRAQDKLEDIENKVMELSLTDMHSDMKKAPRLLNTLVKLRGRAQTVAHPRHLVLAAIDHAIVRVILGGIDSSGQTPLARHLAIRHQELLKSTLTELKETSSIYLPMGHPDARSIQQLLASMAGKARGSGDSDDNNVVPSAF